MNIQVLRYPPGLDFLSYDNLSSDINAEPVPITAEDGGKSRGMLYAKGGEKTVLCVMHPRADMTRHYTVPAIVGAGYAFFGQICRSPGDDLSATTIHEHLLADVAGGLKFLRSRGYENIVLIGNSGAASMYAFYHKQATTQPPHRLTTTAAGDPFDLNTLDMPTADGFIFLGPHLGAGLWMRDGIDPSVTDESDPTSCDPSLDLFNPDNGFRQPPMASEYSAEFLERYRLAQTARSVRIDALAWSMIQSENDRDELASATKDRSDAAGRLAQRQAIAGKGQRMTIYRLDANPESVDLTTTEPGRSYGSLFARRPDLLNYSMHTAKIVDPRAWLSSWSATTSRARLLDNLTAVETPTLVLAYRGDNTVHPDTVKLVYDQSPSKDKQFKLVDGDHFGFFDGAPGAEGGRKAASKVMIEWLQSHYSV